MEYLTDVTTETGRRTGSFQHKFYMDHVEKKKAENGEWSYYINGVKIVNFVSGNVAAATGIRKLKY